MLKQLSPGQRIENLSGGYYWLLAARAFLILLLADTSITSSAFADQPPEEIPGAAHFSQHIAPILLENCMACHCAKKAEGNYRLDTFEELLKSGDTGAEPIQAGLPEQSELLRRLTTQDDSERMPADGEPLTEAQIRQIQEWIEAGASFDGQDRNKSLPFVIPPPVYPAPPATYPGLPVTAVAFSPDGSRVYVAGHHELTVWETATGQLERRIGNLNQRIFSIAVGPDSKVLAVACGEPGRSGEVRLVDMESGRVQAVIGRTTDVALDVAFRPNTQQLAIASADSIVRIIDYQTMEVAHSLAIHADWVTALAFSADGRFLATASRDKTSKVFDIEAGQMLANYTGHAAAVRGVAFTADGSQVLSTGDDKKMHRWNVSDVKRIAEVALGGDGFRLVRHGDSVYIPSAARNVLKIDLTNNQIVHSFTGSSEWVLSVARSEINGNIAAGGFDSEVRVWTQDGQLLQHWQAVPK